MNPMLPRCMAPRGHSMPLSLSLSFQYLRADEQEAPYQQEAGCKRLSCN